MASFKASSSQASTRNSRITVKNKREESSVAGRETSNDALHYEFPSEDDLNSLTEEQLEELLQQARDVNRRLKNYEKMKNCQDNSCLREGSSTDVEAPKILLPLIDPSRPGALVSQEHVIGNLNQTRKSNKEQVRRLKTEN